MHSFDAHLELRVVLARGKAKLQDYSDWLIDQLNALTTAREAARAAPWSVADAPRDYIEAQMRNIVGIEIEIAVLEGKWKVSQNQPEANRRSVAAGFGMEERTREMAQLVRPKEFQFSTPEVFIRRQGNDVIRHAR